jgi:hypothetical protein
MKHKLAGSDFDKAVEQVKRIGQRSPENKAGAAPKQVRRLRKPNNR